MQTPSESTKNAYPHVPSSPELNGNQQCTLDSLFQDPNNPRQIETSLNDIGGVYSSKVSVDLMGANIIKKRPDKVTRKYRGIFLFESITGVAYITQNSPQFVSGHLRLRGKDNGLYPYGYKEALEELFGSCHQSGEEIEVCSGEVGANSKLVTVDINPERNPTCVLDGQYLPEEWKNRFDRWNCDPPYSEHAAKRMYGTDMPSVTKLLAEGARVTRPGGLLFLLLGTKNMQWHPKSTIRIGWLGITIVPNQEVRTIHCYLKR